MTMHVSDTCIQCISFYIPFLHGKVFNFDLKSVGLIIII